MSEKRIYLYGIMSGAKKHAFEELGLHGEEVTTILFKDISAIVTRLQDSQKITLDIARTHEKVLRTLMTKGTVIPMAFGFSVKDEAEIKNLLMGGYILFRDALERLKEKTQVDVKISWDRRILAEVLRSDGSIRALTQKIKKAPTNQTLKIDLGRRINIALVNSKRKFLPSILAHLKELTKGYKENKIFGDEMLLNASFLLDHNDEQDFYLKMEELEKTHEGKLTFLVIRPLPPYNFVDIQIKKPDYQALGAARNTLGLDELVSISNVKAVYNQMARNFHPDRDHTSNAESRFNEIRKARDILIEYCEHIPFSINQLDANTHIIRKTGS